MWLRVRQRGLVNLQDVPILMEDFDYDSAAESIYDDVSYFALWSGSESEDSKDEKA